MAAQEIEALRERYARHGQEHVFRFWDRLDAEGRERLAAQAASIDLEAFLAALAHSRTLQDRGSQRIEPLEIVRLPEHGGDAERAKRACERGRELLGSGAVAALVVAGGQGTRLGFEGPKGAFPIGPVTDRTLFELQAQKLRGLQSRYGHPVPWCVMTSEATDAPTRALFEEHDWFGLAREDVVLFRQAMAPSVDFDGRLLLAGPDRIAESPDGHGGSLTALAQSGALDQLQGRGVTTIFYYQVDNPLVRIGDPTYLGYHAEAGAEMSCKVVAKRDPMEKMGVLARIDGNVGIVEYTELDDEQRYARNGSDELLYWAGNTAIHVLEVSFVSRVGAEADRLLPYHAAAKKISTVDDEGQPLQPSEPNGEKLERFVFDALPAAKQVAVVEARREEEYAPVKNAEGEDSPESARRALRNQYHRWLQEAGIPLAVEAEIEIDHSVIDGTDDLQRRGIRSVAEAGDAVRVAQGASA
jgi:UDP-N-acetylglucosamine/UDP-N-acetylgalactosamine diphosphorylase